MTDERIDDRVTRAEARLDATTDILNAIRDMVAQSREDRREMHDRSDRDRAETQARLDTAQRELENRLDAGRLEMQARLDRLEADLRLEIRQTATSKWAIWAIPVAILVGAMAIAFAP